MINDGIKLCDPSLIFYTELSRSINHVNPWLGDELVVVSAGWVAEGYLPKLVERIGLLIDLRY